MANLLSLYSKPLFLKLFVAMTPLTHYKKLAPAFTFILTYA
jgi:hypothetical protein